MSRPHCGVGSFVTVAAVFSLLVLLTFDAYRIPGNESELPAEKNGMWPFALDVLELTDSPQRRVAVDDVSVWNHAVAEHKKIVRDGLYPTKKGRQVAYLYPVKTTSGRLHTTVFTFGWRVPFKRTSLEETAKLKLDGVHVPTGSRVHSEEILILGWPVVPFTSVWVLGSFIKQPTPKRVPLL